MTGQIFIGTPIETLIETLTEALNEALIRPLIEPLIVHKVATTTIERETVNMGGPNLEIFKVSWV
jgi:hypothetical protein